MTLDRTFRITGGELFDRIVDESFDLTEEVVASYLKQLCGAVGFMHSNNILHLDLKVCILFVTNFCIAAM